MLKILYNDAHLVVALKPAGLLAVPGRGADKQDCLSARLATTFGEVHIAHRLDQATSGLMVFARTLPALRQLHRQFRDGEIGKTYEALVHGKPAQAVWTIDLPLAVDWPNRPKQKVDWQCGKASVTQVEVLDFDAASNVSRVRLIPVTGRTHQLRVHLQAAGHAVVGDALYGRAQDAGAARLMLHAARLVFAHPVTGEPLRFDVAPAF